MAELWLKATEDLTDDELAAATAQFLCEETKPWWPMPGKLRALVPRIVAAKKAEQIDDADEAWAEVLRLIGHFGYYNRPDRLDAGDNVRDKAMKMGVLACGGWQSLCASEESMLMTHRASFRAAYRSQKGKAEIRGDWDHSRALSADEARALPAPDRERVRSAARALAEDMGTGGSPL